MKTLSAQNINADAFKPFGTLIELPQSSPSSANEMLNYWKQQGVLKVHGDVEVGVLQMMQYNLEFTQMEKHAETPELLVSLGGGPFVIAVSAPSRYAPEPEDVLAFKVQPDQALLMQTGCWHWAPCPLDETKSTFLVIFKSNTSENDLVIEDLSEPFRVEL